MITSVCKKNCAYYRDDPQNPWCELSFNENKGEWTESLKDSDFVMPDGCPFMLEHGMVNDELLAMLDRLKEILER